MDSNIQTLVFKAKQGDNSAFSTLYQIYYPKMKGICINILKEDKDVIDDLVQDAFILALVSLKDLKNPNRFGQWLTSITSNLALKYKEKGNTFRYISLSDIDESVIDCCDDCRNTVSSIQYEDIMAEIDKLPVGYKKVFKLSVLDGLSHQEIAKLLDIAPHSSSSQLARAKALLRNKLSQRTILIMVLVLIIIPVYKQLITKKQLISENDTNITRRRKIKGPVSPASKNDVDSTNCTPKQNPCTHYHKILTIETIAAMRDDTTEIKHNIIANITDTLRDEKQFAVNRTDSILVKDSIIAPNLYKESWITENLEVHKRNKWQLLAAGSLGTTLVQSVCKFMKSNDITNDLPSGPDQPTDPTNPSGKYFTTWEDYAKELHRISQADPTTENVAMADIADHNSGKIVEVEHHDKPITLSIAVNKNIGKRWSLETGLQYSYLKSYLILGTGSYRVDKEQKLHYLGVPFKQ